MPIARWLSAICLVLVAQAVPVLGQVVLVSEDDCLPVSCVQTTPQGVQIEFEFDRTASVPALQLRINGDYVWDLSAVSEDLDTGGPRSVDIELLELAPNLEVLQVVDPYPGSSGDNFECAFLLPIVADYVRDGFILFTANSSRSIQCNGLPRSD